MKITAIDTVRIAEFPSLVFVRVHTDDGLVGLGETFFHADAVEAHMHASVAPLPAGQGSPPDRASLDARCARYVGSGSSGAEMRAASAIDIALWDICGQASGQPLHRAAGRRVARRDPHVQHVRGVPLRPGEQRARSSSTGACQTVDGRGAVRGPRRVPQPRRRARTRSARRRASPAMKIWPFDPYAEAQRRARHLDRRPRSGARAVPQDPRRGRHRRWTSWSSCTRSGTSRRRVGSRGRWSSSSRSGSRTPYGSRARTRSPRCRRSRASPLAVGETLAGLAAFRDLLARAARASRSSTSAGSAGSAQARKIAALAEAFERPVAPHDCTGPGRLHRRRRTSRCTLPNAMCRRACAPSASGWYRELVTELPVIENGMSSAAGRARPRARRCGPRSSSARMHTSARPLFGDPQRTRGSTMRTFEPGTTVRVMQEGWGVFQNLPATADALLGADRDRRRGDAAP